MSVCQPRPCSSVSQSACCWFVPFLKTFLAATFPFRHFQTLPQGTLKQLVPILRELLGARKCQDSVGPLILKVFLLCQESKCVAETKQREAAGQKGRPSAVLKLPLLEPPVSAHRRHDSNAERLLRQQWRRHIRKNQERNNRVEKVAVSCRAVQGSMAVLTLKPRGGVEVRHGMIFSSEWQDNVARGAWRDGESDGGTYGTR